MSSHMLHLIPYNEEPRSNSNDKLALYQKKKHIYKEKVMSRSLTPNLNVAAKIFTFCVSVRVCVCVCVVSLHSHVIYPAQSWPFLLQQ